jgi:hypothetical protein
MSTDQIAIYNIATAAIGERQISSLTEDRESRRLLDEIWTRGQGAVKYLLEQGHWNHAMRAVKIDAETSVSSEFGFTKAFQLPDDFVKLNMISSDERFSYPLTDYEIEAGYIWCEVDPLYVRFVSDHTSYGKDFGKWPETFTLWAGTWMGLQIAPRLKNDIDMEALRKEEKRLRIDARSKDAQMEPPRWPPLSSWSQARLGRFYRHDRGLRNKLTGA